MVKQKKNSAKVCYVLCYRDPNYIRSQVLIEALRKIPGVELILVKNRHHGLLRYLEVSLRLIYARLRYRPDTFIVGFRGHEVFWLLYPAMAGRKIIFDEFINLHDWLVNEHKKIEEKSIITRLIDSYMKWIYRKSQLVLIDTDAHAMLSSEIYNIPFQKFMVVPVGADEETFYPRSAVKPDRKVFEIFFFGSMLPLHGMDLILDAIKDLKSEKKLDGIHFTFAGGKGNKTFINKMKSFIEDNNLAEHVKHIEWVPYNDLPSFIAKSNLCIGGPFGNTGQARRVITGKTYQSLAMGKPTLVGNLEIKTGLEDKQNCLAVDQGSSSAIAESIYWASQHPLQLSKIGASGRKYYEAHFSSTFISHQLKESVLR